MAILILAATELEMAPFYSMFENDVDILIHGIGAGSTAYHVTKALHNKNYDLTLQTGIAGSYENGPDLCEAVVVSSDRYADLAIEENGKMIPLEDAGFVMFNKHPFKQGFLNNPWVEKLNMPDFRLVSAATVNLIHDDVKRTQKIIDLYHPEIETMEGAAYHHVCLMENIPFLQVRGISNKVGVRDKSHWHIKEAVSSTIPIIQDILLKYKSGKLWK